MAQVTYQVETPIDAMGYVSLDGWQWIEASGTAELHVWVGQVINFQLASATSAEECISDIDSSNDPYYLGDTLDWEWDFGDQTSADGVSTPTQFPWNQFRLQPPTPAMYEWLPAVVTGGHSYSTPGTYQAKWSVSDRAIYREQHQQYADDDDLAPLDCITIYVHDLSRPLPTDNLNNVAGPNRRNIRWANSDYNTDHTIGYGDEFTMPAGASWRIERIIVWAVPDIPVSPAYHLGDYFSSISLCFREGSGGLTCPVTGQLEVGEDNPTNGPFAVTKVTYTGGLNYETVDGRQNQIWQIDFPGLGYCVAGGSTCFFAVHGVPRVDRLWFMHATHDQPGGDGSILRFDASNPTAGTTPVDPSDWFGGKGSDINIKVFAYSE